MAANPRKSRPNKIDIALSDGPSHGVLNTKRTQGRRRTMIVRDARTSTDQAAGLTATCPLRVSTGGGGSVCL